MFSPSDPMYEEEDDMLFEDPDSVTPNEPQNNTQSTDQIVEQPAKQHERITGPPDDPIEIELKKVLEVPTDLSLRRDGDRRLNALHIRGVQGKLRQFSIQSQLLIVPFNFFFHYRNEFARGFSIF